MRHKAGYKKLGRTSAHRNAMLKNMAISLLRGERIKTTLSKAKVLRPFVEKLITLAKRGDLHARRLAGRSIHDKEVLQKLFGDISARMAGRSGGYTRVMTTGNRIGDNAAMAMIELVDRKAS